MVGGFVFCNKTAAFLRAVCPLRCKQKRAVYKLRSYPYSSVKNTANRLPLHFFAKKCKFFTIPDKKSLIHGVILYSIMKKTQFVQD